jgi:RNA polymerase sigma factor (sigma-70 family)
VGSALLVRVAAPPAAVASPEALLSTAWVFSDEVAVARARNGDRAALESIYRRFEGPVYTLAVRLLRDSHEAEDVLQETFLEVMRSLPRFRGEGSFAGWVRRIAASKAVTRLRRSNVRHCEPLDAETIVRVGDHGARADGRVDLERALDRLSGDARAVLWLHDVEGYTHEEIAALFGRSSSFSKSQLSRAHLRLKELLSKGGRHE